MDDASRSFSPAEIRAWRGLLAVWNFGFPAIEKNLRPFGIIHIEYGILSVLSLEPDGSMSLGRLAKLAGMTPSRLTARMQPLIEKGLVVRKQSAVDGRSFEAHLTAEGGEFLKQISPSHIRSVRETFFSDLTKDEIRELGTILQKWSAGLGHDEWWQSN